MKEQLVCQCGHVESTHTDEGYLGMRAHCWVGQRLEMSTCPCDGFEQAVLL